MARYEEIQSKIHAIEARIEEHSTELRVALEELAEQVASLEDEPCDHPDDKETYYTVSGEQYSSAELSDLADMVNDIEVLFDADGK